MRRIFFFFFCIVGFYPRSFAQELNTQYYSLECVEIINPQMESVLDSVLTQERVKPYFQENLIYAIHVLKDGILIRAVGKNYFSEDVKGVFQYKNHYFIVVIDDWKALAALLFARTDRRVDLPFWKNNSYKNEQGRTVFIVPLDDVMVYLYGYKDNKFEKIPFGNHLLVNP